MPRGDGTGPWGMGPMMGRMSGYCAGYGMPGHEYQMSRQGFRKGFGRGRGFLSGRGSGRRFMNRADRFFSRMPYDSEDAVFSPTLSQEDEKQFLQNQAGVLKSRLNKIKQRLDRLAIYEAKKD
jgi:hypothetical protein